MGSGRLDRAPSPGGSSTPSDWALTGYTSQPAYAPDDRDGTGLLALGQEGITVLGQAYGQLRYKDYALLTGGRLLVTEGFVNPQDNRMIPNTFEGATLTGTLGPVDYALGYLTAMKRRNFDSFDDMATVAGATTGENGGMILTTVNFVPDLEPRRPSPRSGGSQVFLGNYYVTDIFNTVFLNPEYRLALTEDWRLRFGGQYWDQLSVGDQLLGDFSTWQAGGRIQVGWRELTFLAMGSVTGDDAGIRSPYGGFRGYISLAETDPNLANEKAWEAGVTYDWGGKTFDPAGPRALDLAPLLRELGHQGQAAERPGGQEAGDRSLHRLPPAGGAGASVPHARLQHLPGAPRSGSFL